MPSSCIKFLLQKGMTSVVQSWEFLENMWAVFTHWGIQTNGSWWIFLCILIPVGGKVVYTVNNGFFAIIFTFCDLALRRLNYKFLLRKPNNQKEAKCNPFGLWGWRTWWYGLWLSPMVFEVIKRMHHMRRHYKTWCHKSQRCSFVVPIMIMAYCFFQDKLCHDSYKPSIDISQKLVIWETQNYFEMN